MEYFTIVGADTGKKRLLKTPTYYTTVYRPAAFIKCNPVEILRENSRQPALVQLIQGLVSLTRWWFGVVL